MNQRLMLWRRTFVAALAATLAATLGVVIAPEAQAASCTTVWLTVPSRDHVLSAGRKRCLDLNDGAYDNQLIRIYSRDNPELRQIDWVDRWALTTYAPNSGRYQPTADRIRSIAADHGLKVQFANRDQLGRLGCAASSGFPNSVSGTYMPSAQYPGEGLIRIGTGTTDRCMRYRSVAVNTAKFEFSRALIEQICGTPGPPMAGTTYLKIAAVTSAYAQKYLDATVNPGGALPTVHETRRATNIHNGDCG